MKINGSNWPPLFWKVSHNNITFFWTVLFDPSKKQILSTVYEYMQLLIYELSVWWGSVVGCEMCVQYHPVLVHTYVQKCFNVVCKSL